MCVHVCVNQMLIFGYLSPGTVHVALEMESFPGPGACHLSRPSGQEAPEILTPPGLSVLVQGIELGGCVGHLTPVSSAAIISSIIHTRP